MPLLAYRFSVSNQTIITNIMWTLGVFKMPHNTDTSRDQLTTLLGKKKLLQSVKGWLCFVVSCNGLFFAAPHPEEIVFY